MASSNTVIANLALAKIGSEKISDLSDGTKRARLINEVYETLRRKVLASHPWNFAIKRASLSLDAEAPAFGYAYRYLLPSDYLRVLGLFENCEESTYSWEVENGFILTDSPTCFVKYVFDESNTSKFTGGFEYSFACLIAANIAYAITQSSTLAQTMRENYKESLAMARSFDAQESRKNAGNNDVWLNSRY